MTRSISRRSVLAAGLAASVASVARAQEYPDKPIRLVVGYQGGGMDISARLLSARLPALLGQQIVIDNRPGASGMIAPDIVSKAAPDGYTILFGEGGALINPVVTKSSADPMKGLVPVSGAFIQPLTIVVSNAIGPRTPREFIAMLKANPEKYNFATSGVSTINHLGFRMMLAQMNIPPLLHVAYKGGAQILPDLMSGQVNIAVLSAVSVLPSVRGGRMRAVALMNPEKLPGAEDIPPISDAVPGFNVSSRQFVMAPPGTPTRIVDRLSEAIRGVLTSPEMVQASAQQGNIPWPLTPSQLAAELSQEMVRWTKVITEQKIDAS